MRTLRLSLVGTVMLVLLAPSTVGLAQSADEPPTPGWVSGRLADVTLAGYAREAYEAGRLRVVGESFVGQQSADDPRLSGSVTTLATRDELNSAGDFVTVGMLMVENDEGAWRGRYSGLRGPGNAHHMQAELVGEGGYEGLSALLVYDGKMGFDFFEGFVFEGGMPPMPPER